jgi:hypothetical protein
MTEKKLPNVRRRRRRPRGWASSPSQPSTTLLTGNGTPAAQTPRGSFPAGTLDGTPFTAVPHKRTLVPGPKFEVEAGAGKVTEEYSGPAAVTNAVATPPGDDHDH